MEEPHVILCIMSVSMKIVNWEIVPNVSCWIEARPLKTGYLCVISLTVCELSGLVDVSCVIYAIRVVCVLQ